ncbi:mcfN [Symbiodinium natans]|uniref:McfN protein n=1 Tax=Symbiodinium natans TaxID=878477 RepID=A0A812KPC5_9DINO|nr:mcfN [Symbiodinium natans]
MAQTARCAAKFLSSATAFGAGMAAKQGWDLRGEWRSLRERASPCLGPDVGQELGGNGSRKLSSTRGAGGTSPTGASSRPLLVLFLGDSLVSGVGGQASATETPAPAALPRHVAAHLAEHMGEVRWASVGITGADVEHLAREGLPRLRLRAAEVVSSLVHSSCSTPRLVVVLVVGANDLRGLRLSYRLRLRQLVHAMSALHVDVEGIFLPAVALADAPMLQRYPLRLFLAPLCFLWEREKQKAISWCHGAEVLPFPTPPEGTEADAFFSADRMHPSPVGYEWWAKALAEQIRSRLETRAGQAGGCRLDHPTGV